MLELWLKLASRYLCSTTDCTKCHELLSCFECSGDIAVNDERMKLFIRNVTAAMLEKGKRGDKLTESDVAQFIYDELSVSSI